eukprot:TRINITY_DN4729_c0_g1_i4.p2 TRINITY_DN4729_c0_g1~~TRINITY_DN4729_c0_g1_i4.p2  ORF type:complete len:268 (+),score=109.08 TRINITY_DN4729_c0_g1_i4:1031-1834(+)
MIACFIGGFVFSMIFVGSFDIAVKAIMMCYLMDCEMFIGEQRYGQQFIREFMDYFAQQSKQVILVKNSQQVKGREANEEDEEDDEKEEEEEEEEDDDDEYEYDSEYEEDEEDEEEEDEEDEDDEDDEDEEEQEEEQEEEEPEEDDEELQNQQIDQEEDQQQIEQQQEQEQEQENEDGIDELQLVEHQEEQQEDEEDEEAQGERWGEERKILHTDNDRSNFEELMVQSASHLSSRLQSRGTEGGEEPAAFFQGLEQQNDESINFEEEG